MSTPDGPPRDIPAFLAPLAHRAGGGEDVLVHPLRPAREGALARRSAVLLLLAGTSPETARLLLEERSHRMRSQPGQFALPGGRVEPEDADDAAAALREAHEETGLAPEDVRLLGAFAAIPMPWRRYSVRPVLAWAPDPPALGPLNPAEVERVVWAPLVGEGSLTDPTVRCTGLVDGAPTGPAFDLPGEAFVWGFTAGIVAAMLEALALPVTSDGAPPRELPVPELRRRAGL